MKTLKAAAAIPIITGYLLGQPQQTKQSNMNSTSFKGTLVDSGCASSRITRQNSGQKTNQGTNAAKSLEKQFTNSSSSYPVTPSIPRYGLITEDCKCTPLDLSSSEKVSGLIKIKSDWSENAGKIAPTKVEVLGAMNNDGTITIEDIELKAPINPR